MRADCYAVFPGELNRAPKDSGIAAMKAGRDACGGDRRQQRRIVADHVRAERLADVRIQVDARASCS